MYKLNNHIVEDFEDEIIYEFNKADWEAGRPVEVIYCIDSKTGQDIELWRNDYKEIAIPTKGS